MSLQESNNPLETSAPARVPASARRKAKPDIYTVLLVIALLAVILGIVFLWLYNADYGWNFKGGPGVGMTQSAISLQRSALARATVGPCETASGKSPIPTPAINTSLIPYLSSRTPLRARMLQNLLSHFRCDLAVDLGTANTVICLAGEGVVLDEPSVVAVQQGTGRILSGGCAVGHLAKQMEGRTPDSIAVVHPLRSGVIADFELCEAMLRYFLGKVRRPGRRLRPRVLVGVPGCITPVEKRAVFNSVHRAGAGAVWVMPEAKAAAIGTGLPWPSRPPAWSATSAAARPKWPS